jgi:hypothetical protein
MRAEERRGIGSGTSEPEAVLALAGTDGKARVPGAGNAAEPLAGPGGAERGRWLGRLFWIAFAYVPETESQVTPSGALHA